MIALLLLLAAPPVVDPPGTVDPKAEAAWSSADALRRARRSEEALVAFESLATAHPTSRRAVQALAAAGTIARWELEDPARAKRLWIRALQGPSEVPGSDAALNELLALERDTGGVDAELTLVLKLAQRRAGYAPRLWLRAAAIYLEERKDPARALDATRSASRIEGTWWDDAAMMEGRCLLELGRFDEALVSYRKVTASQRATLLGGDENSDLLDDAFLAIAQTLERAGRASEAERAYERLVEEVPHSVYVDDARARLAKLRVKTPAPSPR